MQAVPQWWRERRWQSWILLPLSWIFGGVVRIRAWLYRAGVLKRYRASACVVVIGNITVGGNNKSPLVIALARALKARGVACVVISRGYGGNQQGVAQVRTDSTAAQVGDEPVMIAEQSGVPVFVGRRRAQVAAAVMAAYPETQVIISDDGLQHYALARDIEWVVAATDFVFGNRFLLPAGPLREPVSRLSSVDALLSTKSINAPVSVRQIQFMSQAQGAVHLLSGENIALQTLADAQPLYLISAIARPERLFASIAAQGGTLADYRFFPDHAPLAAEVADFAADGIILMTAKDAVKITEWPKELRERVYVLDYTIQIPHELIADIEERI
ncbi:tetraacyldisaccharide 4'-kinase [Suttonella sp. R2A3]|uniref:tetraacyldisaccharide 4'-kinase n=1 Tax=Suttonella sp. R2A3 TaxID=2908648 RepID=UPI001F3B0D10|nr:tetraacyldisaccharide 4'-kinase [Suttonella sp. R2A3]UJF24652.1 tetraacyldisaccharide 4'-kinase [Suttonella sp. R2A3]